ncbi:MAG: TonB-dependent receptor, partial [Kangiellaceae bacterium]
VWTPDFADLAISLDYFDFEINGQVTQLGAATIVGRCYDSEFFPTDPLCDQFERDPLDDKIDNINDSFLNIASQVNRGYDLSMTYQTDLDIGRLRIQTKHTYQEEDSTELFPDTVRDTNGEFGDPRLTASMNTSLTVDDWTYNWTVNYLGSMSNFERDGGDTILYRGETVKVVNSDDENFYHALSVSHSFSEGLQAVFGVANVFDKRPPQITTIGTFSATSGQTQGDSAFYSQYDWRGRRIFLNLSYQL